MPAISPHATAVVEREGSGPAVTAAAANSREVLRYMHAWRDPAGDPVVKASYKFPHHPSRVGSAAILSLVRNGLARLSQADIPGRDRAGVERHLRRHLEAQSRR